jgi:hypothetical protein
MPEGADIERFFAPSGTVQNQCVRGSPTGSRCTYVMEVVPSQITHVHAVVDGSQGSAPASAWLAHPCATPLHPLPFVVVYRFTSP